MFERYLSSAAGKALSVAVLLLCALQAGAAQTSAETYGGRTALIYTPDKLPAFGSRSLVVVLHGGLGNAQRIASERSESALNLDSVAQQSGFIVAYLNGTPVMRMLGANMLGWNAGSCCGKPAEKKVDDVAYLQSAVQEIAKRHGVQPGRIYGVGHSNGAMMTQRLMCETALYASAVAISGPLENGASTCPSASGKRMLAIHGQDDQNVPVAGGRGSKGFSRVAYASQAATAQVWKNSGALYELQVIPGADHSVASIDSQIKQTQGKTLAQNIANFFDLIGH